MIGHPFIVGGENASVGEFPYQVSIKVWEVNNVSLNMHFCGGFIVDELHVVTVRAKIFTVLGICEALTLLKFILGCPLFEGLSSHAHGSRGWCQQYENQ